MRGPSCVPVRREGRRDLLAETDVALVARNALSCDALYRDTCRGDLNRHAARQEPVRKRLRISFGA